MSRTQAQHLIRTSDGEQLASTTFIPDSSPPQALVICAHAMMVDMRTFVRSRFAACLVVNGYAVLTFNFRGRGQSTLTDWSYDDLVHLDVPAVMQHAQAHHPNLPIFWLGHSLGGHVALAATALGYLESTAGLALISTNVWLPNLEPNPWRRMKKNTGMHLARLYLKVFRTLPIKASGFGTVDEAPTYLKDLISWWFAGTWQSNDGTIDYLDSLNGLEIPILSVVGEGDTLEAHPEAALAFLDAFSPKQSTFLVADTTWNNGKARCNHMNLITSSASVPGWQMICDWFGRTLDVKEGK